jgi:hypothetical protein
VAGLPAPAEQHHFDRIGKDPKWGWDEADAKNPSDSKTKPTQERFFLLSIEINK